MNHLLNIHDKKAFLVQISLVFLPIITPFYSTRIPLYHTSLSVLTLSCIITDTLLFYIYYKNLRHFFHVDPLWLYAFLLLGSFLPTVYAHPHSHALGVYIEWFIIPIITSFLVSHHLRHQPRDASLLTFGIILSLIVVLIDALSYLTYGILTFDHRLTAHYLSPNHLALYIAPILFLVGTLYCYKNTNFYIIASVLIVLSCIILLYTHSFNTTLALSIAATIIVFAIMKKKMYSFFILGSIFFILLFIGYHKIYLDSANITHNSFASRIAIWRSSVFLIQTQPFYGHEIDSFQSHYLSAQKFFPPYPDWAVPTAHNLAFTLIFSGGFFVLLFFIMIVFRILYLTCTCYYTHKDTRILLYGTTFLTIVLCSLADTPYWKNDLSLFFWLIVAIVLSQSSAINDRFLCSTPVTAQKA